MKIITNTSGRVISLPKIGGIEPGNSVPVNAERLEQLLARKVIQAMVDDGMLSLGDEAVAAEAVADTDTDTSKKKKSKK